MANTETLNLEPFFEALSERMYKENSLSDITWALCETNYAFKKLFLQNFFPEIQDVGAILLEREVASDDCRPDFSFYTENQKYIIEVKIYDRDDHFIQYQKQFPNAKYGWIANYYKSDQYGIAIRTWESFYYLLLTLIESGALQSSDKILLKGYAAYLKKACSIIKTKTMKLDNLESLFYFNEIVKRIIQKHNFTLNTRAKNYSENQSGWCFEYPMPGTDRLIYPWIGIYYEEAYADICFFLSKPDFSFVFGERAKLTEGVIFQVPKMESDGCWFEMKKENFKIFDGNSTIDHQEKLLTDFFEEVISLIAQRA